MRILILGGSGFIGSHVVDRFLAEGHDVTVYDLAPERYRKAPAGVRHVIGDLGNVGVLDEVLTADRYDAALHFISTTTPRTSNESPEFDIQSNLIGTLHLLDLCVRHEVGKFVFVSSGGTVYGDIGAASAVDESHPARPICSYGITKLGIEHYLHMYRRIHGLDYVALRIANAYGERQNPHVALGAVNVFLYRAIRGQAIEVWGDGSVERDFIHAQDIAEAVHLATIRPVGGVFNVGSDTGLAIRDLIAEVARTVGVEPVVTWMKQRPYDVPRIVLDSSKLRSAVDWRCRVSLREGMARTAEWIRNTADL